MSYDIVYNFFGENGSCYISSDFANSMNERSIFNSSTDTTWYDSYVKFAYSEMYEKWHTPDDYKEVPSSMDEKMRMINLHRVIYSLYPLGSTDHSAFNNFDEIVAYVHDEFNGKAPVIKKYDEIPTDIDEQLYMVNACWRMEGYWPFFEEDAKEYMEMEGEHGEENAWQEVLAEAFYMSNNYIPGEPLQYPENSVINPHDMPH